PAGGLRARRGGSVDGAGLLRPELGPAIHNAESHRLDLHSGADLRRGLRLSAARRDSQPQGVGRRVLGARGDPDVGGPAWPVTRRGAIVTRPVLLELSARGRVQLGSRPPAGRRIGSLVFLGYSEE